MTEGINWGALMAGVAEALQPVPKGLYEIVVDKCEPKTSSTNKAMWAMQLKIEGGPHNGRVIYNNITLTTDNPQALRMFFVNMHALGLDQQFFATNPSPQQIANALVGRRARIEIDHRNFQGQVRENVKKLMPATGVFATGAPVPTVTGPGPSGPGIPGGVPTPAPATSPSVPPTPSVASPVVPAPAPQPVPVAAPEPGPAAEASFPIPAPVAPAPPSVDVVPDEPVEQGPGLEDVPANVEEPVDPPLPPGMTKEMYAQFMAFQAAQAAESLPGTNAPAAAGAIDMHDAEPATEAPPVATPAPAGAVPPPPPVPF